MRFLTARLPDGGATAAVAAPDGSWRRLPAQDVGALLRQAAAAGTTIAALGAERGGARLDPGAVSRPAPVTPEPGKVICCGHNYRAHILELGHEIPRHPTLFAKFADTLAGAADEVQIPADVAQVDWEAELAVVVGAPLRRADRAEARRAIAGWTVANDLSMRDWQRRTGQWLPGKAFDRTTPLGPWLTTPDEVDPGDGLTIRCVVNGVVVQEASTADLVFDSADLLAYISTFTRLRPGDVVLTGTPGGVGVARTPPRFLDDGDLVEVSVEGLGALATRIRRVPAPTPTPAGASRPTTAERTS